MSDISCKTIYDQILPYRKKRFGILQYHTGPCRTVVYQQEFTGTYETIWDQAIQYESIQNFTGPYETIGDYTGTYGTIRGQTRPN